VNTFAKDVGDDRDLDALMIRVREAALGMGTGGNGTALAHAAGDTPGFDADLVKVIDAQSQWNEQTRKALAELVECLRTLRDDWAEAQKGLQQEMGQLLALVGQLRTMPGAAVGRRNPSAAAARGRRAIASHRSTRVRPAAKGGKQRS
jgi:hypothetical protein